MIREFRQRMHKEIIEGKGEKEKKESFSIYRDDGRDLRYCAAIIRCLRYYAILLQLFPRQARTSPRKDLPSVRIVTRKRIPGNLP